MVDRGGVGVGMGEVKDVLSKVSWPTLPTLWGRCGLDHHRKVVRGQGSWEVSLVLGALPSAVL